MTSENQKEMTIVALTIDDRARSSMLATYPVVEFIKINQNQIPFVFTNYQNLQFLHLFHSI